MKSETTAPVATDEETSKSSLSRADHHAVEKCFGSVTPEFEAKHAEVHELFKSLNKPELVITAMLLGYRPAVDKLSLPGYIAQQAEAEAEAKSAVQE